MFQQKTFTFLDSSDTDMSAWRSCRAPHAVGVLPLAMPPVSCVFPTHPSCVTLTWNLQDMGHGLTCPPVIARCCFSRAIVLGVTT